MCKWYCTSEGPSTNLKCLNCGCRYCAACWHGEAGKMPSMIKCGKCGKKPTVQANADRGGWKDVTSKPTGVGAEGEVPGLDGGTDPSFVRSLRADGANEGSGAGVFSRLTDSSKYTGAHKHRFDDDGHGRGTGGRDSDAKGRGHVPPSGVVELEQVFGAHCGAKSDLDGRAFAKLCKDCRLLDKTFTTTDADILFTKVVEKGQRRIDFGQFLHALELIGQKKGLPVSAVEEAVARSGGPTLHATATEAVRFHDDKSTYTGVHQRGGPEPVVQGLGSSTQLASHGMRRGHQ